MAELKTKKTELSVIDFLKSISDENRRKDCEALTQLMEKACKAKARMWGTSIVGFGDIHLKYESGRELDWFICGFSPRKQALTIYTTGCSLTAQTDLLNKLGKYKTGKGCLYINSMKDIDIKVLNELILLAVKAAKK